MRCSICGHESPGGSSFCLNCGSSIAQTPPAPSGLPGIVVCTLCRGENPSGMKFCRSCGTSLASSPAASPGYNGQASPSPMPAGMGGRVGAPLASAPSGPLGGIPGYGPPGYAAPEPLVPPAMPPTPPPMAVGNMATSLASPVPSFRPSSQGIPGPGIQGAQGGLDVMTTCPRCGTQTPLGFAYCQQCGFHMQPAPAGELRARSPSMAPPIGGSGLYAPVDVHGGTIAQEDSTAVLRAPTPRPQSPPVATWGTAVLVNRDGSDGQRFALGAEYLVIGRAGADIAFEDDRFLARQHARLERGADGVVAIYPLDSQNGVFRKTDAPVELVDGSSILIGREVLRYERVEPEESPGHALIRHGVALFGSPPRDSWGRLIQLLPSGGYRDVRHLSGEEVVLGREEGDIVFRDDAFMSRRHAAVSWDGNRAQLTDLGSSNGTFVRITGPTTLKHGDHVRMGDQLLRLELGR